MKILHIHHSQVSLLGQAPVKLHFLQIVMAHNVNKVRIIMTAMEKDRLWLLPVSSHYSGHKRILTNKL